MIQATRIGLVIGTQDRLQSTIRIEKKRGTELVYFSTTFFLINSVVCLSKKLFSKNKTNKDTSFIDKINNKTLMTL